MVTYTTPPRRLPTTLASVIGFPIESSSYLIGLHYGNGYNPAGRKHRIRGLLNTLAHPVHTQMRVPRCGPNIRMAKHSLDYQQIRALVHRPRCQSVTLMPSSA